jgi:hypothetical protein
LEHKRSRIGLSIQRGRHLQVEWQGSPVHLDDRPWPEENDKNPVLSNAVDIKIDPGALVFLTPGPPAQDKNNRGKRGARQTRT